MSMKEVYGSITDRPSDTRGGGGVGSWAGAGAGVGLGTTSGAI